MLRRVALSTAARPLRPAPSARWSPVRHFTAKARTGAPEAEAAQSAAQEKPAPRGPFAKYIKLARQYGMPLVVYYLTLNEALVGVITYLLHYDYLGAGDVIGVVKYFGLGKNLDVGGLMDKTTQVGPVTVSARFVTNFGIASAFMSIWTFAQIPFCLATLPHILRVLGRGPKAPVAAAAAKVAEPSQAARQSAVPRPPPRRSGP